MKDGLSLDDFIADNRLLRITLEAHGLGEEAFKKAFVRKILEEGTTDTSAFAVRLNNPDYLSFAGQLDFSDGTLSLQDDVDTISTQYRDQSFEVELGNVDNDMRLALNFKSDIGALAESVSSDRAGWFRVMGSLPLREVLEGALNLPTEFSQIDLDQQAQIFEDRAERFLGIENFSDLADPEVQENVIRRFLLNQQLANGPSINTPGFAALTLLSGSVGAGGLSNLLASF